MGNLIACSAAASWLSSASDQAHRVRVWCGRGFFVSTISRPACAMALNRLVLDVQQRDYRGICRPKRNS